MFGFAFQLLSFFFFFLNPLVNTGNHKRFFLYIQRKEFRRFPMELMQTVVSIG
jgi:hypothetical protein